MYIYTYLYICIFVYIYICIYPTSPCQSPPHAQGSGIRDIGLGVARERKRFAASIICLGGGGGGGTQATCLEHVCCTRVSLYFPVTCNPSRAVTLPNIATSEFPTELPTHTTCAGRARGGGLLPATLPASSGFVLGFEVEG